LYQQAEIRFTRPQELVEMLLSRSIRGVKKPTGEQGGFHFVKAGLAGQVKKGKKN